MKKIFLALTLIALLIVPSYSFELSDNLQIRLALRDYNKALSSENIEKIKEFYTDDYKSSDGFTIEELTQLLEKTHNAYGKIKQKTKINNITIFDNYAVVQLSDKTSAVVHPDKEKLKEKRGILKGHSIYSLYLKKDDNWKIFYDEIIAETTSLKYGIANKIKMELNAPVVVQKGKSYDLSLKMDKPDDIVALASLTNEEIEYPTPEHKEKFRKFPSTGELERIVKANQNDKNEYAIASIGFTQVSVNEAQTKARIEVVGMAYLMKRINMVNLKENNEK